MIRAKLLELLRAIDDLKDVNFETETSLVSDGILDSYSVLVIVVQIEKQFGVRLQIEGSIGQNFDSLAKMENLIGKSQKTSAPTG